MNIPSLNNYNSFKAHCPEIKLGQKVCNTVNKEFPHYSLFKFKPLIDKHLTKIPGGGKMLMNLMMKLYVDLPDNLHNSVQYLGDLFSYLKTNSCFNCHESSILSELVLKLNGIENSYTASVYKNDSKIEHVVCFFNRDGSEYNGIKNNQTIIIDPWSEICDFANNVFKEYDGQWLQYFNNPQNSGNCANNKYHFNNVKSMNLPNEFLEFIKEQYPNLKF